MTKQLICAVAIGAALGTLVARGDAVEKPARELIDVELRFPKATGKEELDARSKAFRAGFEKLGNGSLALGEVKLMLGDYAKDGEAVLLFTHRTKMTETADVIKLCQALGYKSVHLAVRGDLRWRRFTPEEFGTLRFRKPTVLALMQDFCPGCRAKRDALWSDKALKAAILQREVVLFEGNAETDKEITRQVKEIFGVDKLPVVILNSTPMDDKPVVLPGIPEPRQVLKALEEKLPLKGSGRIEARDE